MKIKGLTIILVSLFLSSNIMAQDKQRTFFKGKSNKDKIERHLYTLMYQIKHRMSIQEVNLGNDAKRGWSMIGVNDQNCTILVICFS